MQGNSTCLGLATQRNGHTLVSQGEKKRKKRKEIDFVLLPIGVSVI